MCAPADSSRVAPAAASSLGGRLFISAAKKSSGKTSISIGLARALTLRGLSVQTFKKGPDYIDPAWLALASRRPCLNLDPYISSWLQIQQDFKHAAVVADFALIEGNKGLYDGLDIDGGNCNAALAARLDLPVVLALDARGMTRGIAPLILGYQAFDRNIRIVGVILNLLGGARHEAKLRQVIEHYTDVQVLGALAATPQLEILERHLGLIPGFELADAEQRIDALAQAVSTGVDIDALLRLSRADKAVTPAASQVKTEDCSLICPPKTDDSTPAANISFASVSSTGHTLNSLPNKRIEGRDLMPLKEASLLPQQSLITVTSGSMRTSERTDLLEPLTIAIARDAAFGFYYADDLAAFAAQGAQIISFDTLHDRHLPAGIDGLFIGGGFPETQVAALAANISLRADIGKRIAAGLPTYAECGGLMYLARSLTTLAGETFPLCGVIPGEVRMHPRPVGRGYMQLAASDDFPWAKKPSEIVRCHEFHYSTLEHLPIGARFAWHVRRGAGLGGGRDGFVSGNLLAAYAHLRSSGQWSWVAAFCQFVRAVKYQRQGKQDQAEEFLASPALAREFSALPNSSASRAVKTASGYGRELLANPA